MYTTHTLPNYVQKYFGRPLTLTKTKDGRFKLTGVECSTILDGPTAEAAREQAKVYVQKTQKLSDGRIERYRKRLSSNDYLGNDSYEFDPALAERYPLMFKKPGTRQRDRHNDVWVRLEDDRHCHLHMCAVNIRTGEIRHVTRIEKRTSCNTI